MKKGKFYRFTFFGSNVISVDGGLFVEPYHGRIGTIQEGDLVLFLECGLGKWTRVILGDQVGWVWGYLEEVEDEEQEVISGPSEHDPRG